MSKADHVAEFLLGLYRLRDLDAFAAWIMRELPRLVSADATSYTEVNPDMHRAIGTMDSPEAEHLRLQHLPAFERYMQEHPLITYYQHSGEATPKKISDFLPLRQWRATNIYREFFRYFDLQRQMVVPLHAGPRVTVGVALNRKRRDFNERERKLLLRLLPHLRQAYDNAVVHTRMQQRLDLSNTGLDALNAAVMEVSRALEVIQTTPLAGEFLERAFPGWDPGSTPVLPADIRTWLKGAGTIDSKGAAAGPLVIEQPGWRLTLHTLPHQEQNGFIISMQRYFSNASSEPLEVLGLSPREATILYWVTQGKSNPEIAIILEISPRTVQKHLESIYRTLGVSNRTQAALKAGGCLLSPPD